MAYDNTITLSFRAKRANFSGGHGYSIPKLTSSHISVADRDTLTITLLGTHDYNIMVKRMEKYTGHYLTGAVLEDDPDGWTITPRGNGFMADLSITMRLDHHARP